MLTRRNILLALTLVGFVVPNVMVAIFIAENGGFDSGQYFGDWFGTLPSAQLGADLIIVSITFIAWASWDGPRNGISRWWLTIPATLLVGICFAVPLYLLWREDAVGAGATRTA